MPKEARILTLDEATVALYLLDADGEPITDTPYWADAEAENLTLASEYIYVSSTPSGARYPRKRPVGESHSIEIARLWLPKFDAADATLAADVNMDRGARYAMMITWMSHGEADTAWFRRIYYGVTCDSFNIGSRELFESQDTRKFSAEFFRPKNGKGTPPAA